MSLPNSIQSAMKQAVKVNTTASFPCMVHQCLFDIEELGKRDPNMKKLEKIVSWQNHGKAFRIHDRKRFEEVIMPVWFVRLKYNSFLRQLSLFGFKKIYRETPDVQKGAWYHDLFVQGEPELAKGIQKMGKTKPSTQAQAQSQSPTPATGTSLHFRSSGCFGGLSATTAATTTGSTTTNEMESAITQSTRSYLQLKSSLAHIKSETTGHRRTSMPPPPPPSSSQPTGLLSMLSGAALPMPCSMPVNRDATTETQPIFAANQEKQNNNNNNNNSNPFVGLVLKNLDLSLPDDQEMDSMAPADWLEPTPIPPGGFDTLPNTTPSKLLQQQLFEVLYPTSTTCSTDLDTLEPLAFPPSKLEMPVPHPWAA